MHRSGAGAPGGASQGQSPGAGSAGPGAAQRRRLIPNTAGFGNAGERGAGERDAVAIPDFCLRREDPVHDLGAGGDYWT